MYKFKFLLPLVAALSLSSCAAIPLATMVTSSTPVLAATNMDEKAMYAAEALYNVPAQAYVSANSNGLLSAPVKAKVKPLMVKAYDVLLTVRSAYKLGDAAGFSQRYGALKTLSSQVKALLPSASFGKGN